MCYLRSETYNVITVSRETTAASYNRLSEEEIHLVYAQLARCFSETDVSKLAPEGGWSEQAKSILEKTVPKVANPAIPTIIVFNEAFFGQDSPLSKETVDEITELYKRLPNTYLYMNFLYTDSYTEENKEEYRPQIEISQKRYSEILAQEGDKPLTTIMQPSFVFSDRIQECIEKEKSYLKISKEKQMQPGQFLLFNQTKIFYKGEEIGYYNKSSFCNEISGFLTSDKNLYYVIGNFNTKYSEGKQHLPVTCLTCYDIDVVKKDQMPKNNICVFASNTSASLPLTLNNFNEPGTKLSNFYICADPKSETEGKNISGILSNIRNSFEYSTEESAEEKDIFYLKSFLLTDDSIIERIKP